MKPQYFAALVKLSVSLLLLLLLMACRPNETEQALAYLNANMPYKSVSEKKIINHKGEAVAFSPYNYQTLYEAKDSLNSLLKNHTTFNCRYADKEMVPVSFIKKHTSLMLERRKRSFFIRHLNFNDFCEFVLPYRADKEIFIDYHSETDKHFSDIITSLPNSATNLEKATAINSKLINLLEFDLRSHAQLKEPDIVEVLKSGKGSCNSLTAVTAQAMRYFGIPTAIDECPVWGHRNSGHRWNAILTETGTWIPFGGAETNPGEFDCISDSVKAPKIFRHTFSPQSGFQPPVGKENLPPVFLESNRIDVTNQYVHTTDVEITLNHNISHRHKIVWLSVFNAEKWRIVAWAEIENNKALFKNMGCNSIFYLPVFFENGKTIPAGNPFLLSKNGELEYINGDGNQKPLELHTYNKFFDFKWNIGFPKEGNKMELFYWDEEWKSCGICTVEQDEVLKFKNVPGNALYWLKSYDWDNTWQRIFTVENGVSKWF